MSSGWNFAEVWEVVAEQIPDAPAQIQGDRRESWREFDERANGLAHALLETGVVEQDKVVHYLYNCPEYLESMFGIWKAGLAPVNTNYRYTDDELVYLWDNADAVAVIFHGSFTPIIERIRDRVPRVTTWLWVDDDAGECPEWATPYEKAAQSHAERVIPPWGRSGDHLYILYTGGTTGMPKGVMWRQDDLYRNIIGNAIDFRAKEGDANLDLVRDRVKNPGGVGLPACPLMHGTGCVTQLMVLTTGGSVVTLESRSLDVEELLDVIDKESVNLLAIVGDPFARPMTRALEHEPDRWKLARLQIIASSGVMFSEESKQALLARIPQAIIVDAFSSSEALGMGQSISSAGDMAHTAKFIVGERTRVVDESGADVVPGSGQIGRVAVGGFQPIGYYKDEAKSASTFVTIDGKRYSIPGDFAQVEADGSITVLGRGSVCINTAGEKVFPEEVEEALKTHPTVVDAVAVGVPNERFGEAVTAVVELTPGSPLDEAALISHVKSRLAAYKAPKRIITVDTVGRAPNGKVDYKALKRHAIEELAAQA
jgi:3-oxocholest-4-en-26-oate---CoA ligase